MNLDILKDYIELSKKISDKIQERFDYLRELKVFESKFFEKHFGSTYLISSTGFEVDSIEDGSYEFSWEKEEYWAYGGYERHCLSFNSKLLDDNYFFNWVKEEQEKLEKEKENRREAELSMAQNI